MSKTRDRLLSVRDVAQHLRIARQTVYRIPWLWQDGRVIYVGSHPRWEPSTLELYKRVHTGSKVA